MRKIFLLAVWLALNCRVALAGNNLENGYWWSKAAAKDVQKELIGGADVNVKNKDGETALMKAAEWARSPEAVQVLIDAGADVNVRNHAGETAWYIANKKYNRTIQKVLEQAGAGNFENFNWWKTATVDDVQKLLDKGIDINARVSGKTSNFIMEYVVENTPYPDVLELLIKKGADIHVIGADGLNLLWRARHNKNPKIAEILIDAGVNVKQHLKNTSIIIEMASYHGWDSYLIKKLIDAGADVNAENYSQQTPLMRVIWSTTGAKVQIAKMLIAAGANVNAKDHHGDTALMTAAWRCPPEVVKMLIDAGADVNAKNNSGEIALMKAAWYSSAEVVKMLIQAGADVNAEDNEGKTAWYYAKSWGAGKGRPEIQKILEDAGAKTTSSVKFYINRAIAYIKYLYAIIVLKWFS